MENPIKMDDLGVKPHYFRKHPNWQLMQAKAKHVEKAIPGERRPSLFVKRTQWLYQLVRAAKERPILGGGFIFFEFYFEPWGNGIQFDGHSFQMCWFNHQL